MAWLMFCIAKAICSIPVVCCWALATICWAALVLSLMLWANCSIVCPACSVIADPASTPLLPSSVAITAALVARIVMDKVPGFADLGLPPVVEELAKLRTVHDGFARSARIQIKGAQRVPTAKIAIDEGRFESQIAPVNGFAVDETVRRETTLHR